MSKLDFFITHKASKKRPFLSAFADLIGETFDFL